MIYSLTNHCIVLIQRGNFGIIENTRVIQLVTVAKESDTFVNFELPGVLLLGNVAVLQQLHYSTEYRCLMSGKNTM